MQGITDTDITFFTSMSKAGPLAGCGLIGNGMQSSFNDVDSKDGVDGRQLHLEIKDDGDLPDKTKANVDEAHVGPGRRRPARQRRRRNLLRRRRLSTDP